MPPADPMAGGMPPADPMAGGMPPADPMAGGMPPEDPAMKLASFLKNASQFRRSGKYKYTAANAGTPSRILRDSLKQVVSEMLS
jgi:hypothetical protein